MRGDVGFHPEPRARDPAPRPAPAARVRPDARDRRARRGEDRRASAGRQSGHDPKEIADDRRAGRDRRRDRRTRLPPVHRYKWSEDGIVGTVEIWQGGLSIWGAVAGGAIAVVYLARRRHLDTLALIDAIAPGVVVAQAIGRWGNYFNQELFGRPTTLPWGLEIDARAPAASARYERFATFHPTFLYESMWCLLVFGTIVFARAHAVACTRGRRSRCTSRCTRSARVLRVRCGSTRLQDLRHPLQPAALGA